MRTLIGGIAAKGQGSGRWLLYRIEGEGGFIVQRWDGQYPSGSHRQGGWNEMSVSNRVATRLTKHRRFELYG